jgi:hypothetical protein
MHEKPHFPSLQVGMALTGAVQATSQSPQCATLVPRSTHSLPQRVPAPLQSIRHSPPSHTSPALQLRPQAPQLPKLELISTHAPLQAV